MSKTNRLILIATGLIIVVVAIFGWQRGWFSGGPTYETPALRAEYLPADTCAVIHVNQRELQDSKWVKKEFGPALDSFRNKYVTKSTQLALGVDSAKDVDWVQMILTLGDRSHPLVLLAGPFEPAKFKLEPNGLHQVNKPGDRYRLYELPDAGLGRQFTLAPSDHLLLMCENRQLVDNVLTGIRDNKSPTLEDAQLAAVLTKLDRKQSIWGAASLKKLRDVPKVDSAILEAVLRPIFVNTEAIYGGIVCGDDVDASVFFLADKDEKAIALQRALEEACTLATTARLIPKLANVPEDLAPLVKLLSSGKVTRDGFTVTLHCHLP